MRSGCHTSYLLKNAQNIRTKIYGENGNKIKCLIGFNCPVNKCVCVRVCACARACVCLFLNFCYQLKENKEKLILCVFLEFQPAKILKNLIHIYVTKKPSENCFKIPWVHR